MAISFALNLTQLKQRIKDGYYQFMIFKIGGYSFEKEITQAKNWAS
jgi:hypothetical protein